MRVTDVRQSCPAVNLLVRQKLLQSLFVHAGCVGQDKGTLLLEDLDVASRIGALHHPRQKVVLHEARPRQYDAFDKIQIDVIPDTRVDLLEETGHRLRGAGAVVVSSRR